MTQPSPRRRVESMIRTNRNSTTVWSAPEVEAALDAYRDDIALSMGRDLLRTGLRPFLGRLIGEPNAELILEAVRSAVLREDAGRAAVLREAAEIGRELSRQGYSAQEIANHLDRLAGGPR